MTESQVFTLFKKDFRALFFQRSIIISLLIPMVIIAGFGILPQLVGNGEATTVVLFNQDQAITGNGTEVIPPIGDKIVQVLLLTFDNDSSVDIKVVNEFNEFASSTNGIWIPSNFTNSTYYLRQSVYFSRVSTDDLDSRRIMGQVIAPLISQVVTHEVVKEELPVTVSATYFTEEELRNNVDSQDRFIVGFSISYMVFLILVLSATSVRVIGFNAEKESGMMEVLLSKVRDRRDMILSKLTIGVLYGIFSVMSYVIGFYLNYYFSRDQENSFSLFSLPEDILTPRTGMILVGVFILLSLMSMGIGLYFQLSMGKEGGERIANFVHMSLSFMFYFPLAANPLSESVISMVNPFFWAYRIGINLIYNENLLSTLSYFLSSLLLIVLLVRLSAQAIEREQVIFD